jgi:hypothetical protein
MAVLTLQPKQSALYYAIKQGRATVIGGGGGRGSAKSSGGDRVTLILLSEQQGMLACMVMRNFDQVFKYHIEPIRRDFGDMRIKGMDGSIEENLKTSMPASLKMGRSQLDFSYAENMDDIVRRFRSGNYDLIIIDQAEQFSWREIVEIRKATRSKGGKTAKLVLLFNMRGAGIQDLRKRFYLREFNKDEDPQDYAFIKFNPWDNVEWVRAALEEDGIIEEDYYGWSDEQRKEYAARRGPYTRQLATDDEVIRKSDWEGDWDSLEGAYFANSFDLEAVRIDRPVVEQLKKSWATLWMAQDWGRTHWCATGWALRIGLKPSEAKELLGWELVKPINITCIYREMVVNEKEAPEVAQDMLDCMLPDERGRIRQYFLSPEEVTDAANSIGNQQSRVLRQGGCVGAGKADNDRKGGYGLLSSLFKATKGSGWGVDAAGKRFQYDDAILISSECVETLKAIPMLQRDPKNLDDVYKTDKSAAKLEQDLGDMLRYLVKSMLSPRAKPKEEEDRERLAQASTVQERSLLQFRLTMERDAQDERAEQRRPEHWT